MPDRVVLFAGPSLPNPPPLPASWEVRPPARRGDFYRVLREQPRAIVLVDGEFHGCPSVWHREILDALAEGIAVVGASSMGALRAAELHGLGMIGCGRIFEDFRNGILNDDDEVALVYGPQAVGYPAMSEPMVNLRATLALARSEGPIDAEQERTAIAHAKALHFPERSHAAVLAAPPFVADPALAQRYRAFVAHRAVDQKRADALAAVRLVREERHLRAAPIPARESPSHGQWATARAALELDVPPARLPAPSEMLRRAGLADHDERPWWTELSFRWFACRWAAEHVRPEPQPTIGEPPGATALSAVAWRRISEEAAQAARAVALIREVLTPDDPLVRLEFALATTGDPLDACARRRIVAAWATQRRIAAPAHEVEAAASRFAGLERASLQQALEERVTADWVVARGPAFFGHVGWSFPVALLRELQRLGRGEPVVVAAGA
jgi:hypothetical protein